MKPILTVLTLVILSALLWIGWKFQPWMAAGQAVNISRGHFGDYDFQIWQRRNTGVTEPFATGLFARKQKGHWHVFLLDFEDTYHPSILVRKEGSAIAVFRGKVKLGSVDESLQSFKRESDGAPFPGTLLDDEPPGNWWLKPQSQ